MLETILIESFKSKLQSGRLIHVRKLAQIEQHAAEIRQAVRLGVGAKDGHFFGRWGAAGGELVGAADLAFQGFGILFDALGELGGHVEGEFVIE